MTIRIKFADDSAIDLTQQQYDELKTHFKSKDNTVINYPYYPSIPNYPVYPPTTLPWIEITYTTSNATEEKK